MSQLEVDKVIPQSGTTLTLGESGDTVSVPSGATLDASNATLTLPDDSVTTAKIDDGAVTSAKITYPLTTFSSTGIDDNGTSTAITINSSNNVALAGNIGLGGATPTTSGTGITFPATASASTDANTLDDYEEGTWTPVITASSAPSVVYATQEGFYTKIGRNVVLSARISTTSVSGGSGSVSLSGVPFTPASSANPYENGGKVFVEFGTFTGESPIDVRVVSTSAFLYYRTSITGGETNVQVADLKTTAGNTFSFSINLRV